MELVGATNFVKMACQQVRLASDLEIGVQLVDA
jgi:hypothetical protein